MLYLRIFEQSIFVLQPGAVSPFSHCILDPNDLSFAMKTNMSQIRKVPNYCLKLVPNVTNSIMRSVYS